MPSKEGQSLSKGLENNPNQPSALQPTSSFSLSQVGKKRSSQVKIADGVSMHTDKSPLKNGTLGEGSPVGTSKSGSGAMITGVDIAKNPSEQEDNIIFEVNLVPVEILLKNIDGSVPMDEFTAAKFCRVKNNILSALTFLRENKKTGVDTTKDLNSLSVWKKLIGSKFNEDIINDGFWLVVLKKNTEKFALEGSSSGGLLKKKTVIQGQPCLKGKTQGSRGGSLGGQGFSAQYEAVENALLDRMACSYHDMMEEFQGEEYKLFFQIYFDIVAQGVFYSFFYAFPKSRQEFDDKYKRYVFSIFTDLFTNMDISYHSNFIKGYKFIDGWKLDLGAGDVLKQIQRDSECIDSDNEEDPHKKAANNGARNHLRGQPTKKKVQLKVRSNNTVEIAILSNFEKIPRFERLQNKELFEAEHNEVDSL